MCARTLGMLMFWSRADVIVKPRYGATLALVSCFGAQKRPIIKKIKFSAVLHIFYGTVHALIVGEQVCVMHTNPKKITLFERAKMWHIFLRGINFIFIN